MRNIGPDQLELERLQQIELAFERLQNINSKLVDKCNAYLVMNAQLERERDAALAALAERPAEGDYGALARGEMKTVIDEQPAQDRTPSLSDAARDAIDQLDDFVARCNGDDRMNEGYLLRVDDRMFWDNVHASLAQDDTP